MRLKFVGIMRPPGTKLLFMEMQWELDGSPSRSGLVSSDKIARGGFFASLFITNERQFPNLPIDPPIRKFSLSIFGPLQYLCLCLCISSSFASSFRAGVSTALLYHGKEISPPFLSMDISNVRGLE